MTNTTPHAPRGVARAAPVSAAMGCPSGAMVLTMDGPVNVADLAAGAQVVTRSDTLVTLRRIERSSARVWAVSIAPGALGNTGADLLLPASQTLLLRGAAARAFNGQPQAMVLAGALVDGETITDLGERQLDLYTLHFDRPQVFQINGLCLSCATPFGRSKRRAA